jgi:hypothetical protein
MEEVHYFDFNRRLKTAHAVTTFFAIGATLSALPINFLLTRGSLADDEPASDERLLELRQNFPLALSWFRSGDSCQR